MKSMIRMRMSSHDAHYGGNLVDGARMLQLFGFIFFWLYHKSESVEIGSFSGWFPTSWIYGTGGQKGVDSVSYTHLDVYKRQSLVSLNLLEFFLSEFISPGQVNS